MITEVKVEGAPKVIPPKFHCDNELGESIPEPLPNRAFALGIFGQPGSGKSSMLVSLLTAKRPNRVYRGVFTDVHMVCPPHSRASLANTLYEDHPPDKVHDDLTADVLTAILDRCKATAEEGENSLIVIDDCAVALKEKEVEKLLRKLIFNRRHYHTSLIIVSQTYNSMPLSLRKTLSHFIAFKPANRKEIANIFEELIFQPKSVADEILEYTYQGKRDFLYGDSMTGKLYRNFNLLKLNGD